MKITLPLCQPAFDDGRLTQEVKKDFDNGCQIYIFKDENSWVGEPSEHVFSVWIEYDKDFNSSIMMNADLEDLEMFAHSLLKSIEILRRDYESEIKERIKNGSLL